jgi:hypothetical protein
MIHWEETSEKRNGLINYWCMAHKDNNLAMIYAYIENSRMNAQVECSIVRRSKNTEPVIMYFTRDDDTGFEVYLKKWIRKTIDENKKLLEERL